MITENGKKIRTSQVSVWDVNVLDNSTILACLESYLYLGDIEDGDNVRVIVEYWKDENKFTHNVQVFDEDGNYLENDDDVFYTYVSEEQTKTIEKDLFKLLNSEVKLTETAKELIRCYLTFGNNNLHLKDCGLFVRSKEVQYITRIDDNFLSFYIHMADGSVLESAELDYNDATEILHALQRLFPI